MSSETARSTIQSDGFLIVRNAFPRSQVLELGRKMEAELTRFEQSRASIPVHMRMSLERSEMPVDGELAQFRLDPLNYAHLTQSMVLIETLQSIMGEPYLWHYPTMFRKMSPQSEEGFLPFHQDFSYNGHYPHLYTCWVPLNDCGVKAPSISVVRKKIQEKFEHTASGKWEYGIPQDLLDETLASAPVMDLEFKAGDAAIFDELTLHRTFSSLGMDQYRLSMDARAIPLSSISPEIRRQRKFVAMDREELIVEDI
jgi:hypothetical protein